MTTSTSPLVGRDATLSDIRRVIYDAAEGTGACIVIEGPPGIGKSRLLQAACDEAAASGMAVAAAQATQLDRAAPLTTLLMALQSIEAPWPEIPFFGDTDGNRLRPVGALRETIEDYVRSRALVIALDDAQWVDELTSLALRILVPALASSPVLWILARRPVPTRSPAQEAIDWLVGEGARRFALDPLAEDAVSQLCGEILGAAPDSATLSLACRCGGNPFLIEELFTALRDDGQVAIADGVATVNDDFALPPDFLTAVHKRLRGLSEEAHRLLETASVLSRPFTLHEAAGLLGRSAVDLVPAASEVVEAGALVNVKSELVFRHDLIREAVYDGLPEPVRMALHREAAGVVEAEGRSPLEIAEHLVRSGRKGDARAVEVLLQAAERVAPTAPATAADLLLQLLQLLDEADPARARLTAQAVPLLASAGRVLEARQLAEEALRAGIEPPVETAILLGLSEALKHAGYNTGVVNLTRRALARDGVPDHERAHLLAIQAHGLLYTDDAASADEVGAQAAVLGEQTGEHAARVYGIVARSVVARVRGDLDVALTHAREAVEIADGVGGEALHRHPRLWLAAALAATDRLNEADSVYEVGQREADALGTGWSQPLWHYYRAELRLAAGRLDDVAAEAEAGVQVAEQLAALALAVPLLAILSQAALRTNDMDAAERLLCRAEELVAEGISVGPEDYIWRLGLLEEAKGRPKRALDVLQPVYETLPQRRLLLSREPSAAAKLVQLATGVGARSLAERVAVVARQYATVNPSVPSLEGAAAHAEGLLHGDLQLLHAAVDAYRRSPRPLDRAAALEDTGLAEEAAGHRKEAIALLQDALSHYESCGAGRDAARARQALRSLGIRSKRRVVEQPTRWRGLTESEWRVVQLVTQGLTNREVANRLFLSPHTVDSHLRHSFAKLGVTSRVELTREVLAAQVLEDHAKT